MDKIMMVFGYDDCRVEELLEMLAANPNSRPLVVTSQVKIIQSSFHAHCLGTARHTMAGR